MDVAEPVGPEDVESLIADVLHRPAAEGARIIALHWLHQLIQEREQWGEVQSSSVEPPDPERTARTLHKARVALRRLRAVAREHREELGDVFNKRIDKALRALGRSTNSVRDRDVQLEWLDAETEGLDDDARAEAATLRGLLSSDSAPTLEQVEAAFVKHHDTIAARLHRRLSWYDRRHRVGDQSYGDTRYADAVANRLLAGARRIERDIEQLAAREGEVEVSSANVQEQLHDIRLRLKRHRAMLAPLSGMHPALASLFDLETRGQDLLGAMRDADVLGQRAAMEGLHSLERVLADTRLAKLVLFLDEWVKSKESVRQHFDAAITALRELTRAPAEAHGLTMEIERKFLLSEVPPEAIAMPPIVIEQGWIPGTSLRERLRRSTYPDGRVRCTRTIKLGKPEARIEIEEDTGNAIFQSMWALTTSARIRKRRHVVRDASYVWEIDVFTDRELVLAEVELDAVDAHVTIPDWLTPFVVREVTGEIAYLNSQMARPELAETVASQ